MAWNEPRYRHPAEDETYGTRKPTNWRRIGLMVLNNSIWFTAGMMVALLM